MSKAAVAAERLNSWKEIASYVGRDVRTVIRWERQRGLPVHRVPGGGRQVVFAFPQEIDDWLASGHATVRVAVNPIRDEISAGDFEPQVEYHLRVADSSPRKPSHRGHLSIRPHIRKKLIVSAVIVATAVVATTLGILWSASQRMFLIAGETQITNDGFPKAGLVTDGSNLYFGEWRDGRIVLLMISVRGGPAHEIPTPFDQAEPVAVSNDGRRLLVLGGEGMEMERALWTLQIGGGSAQRVGNFLCHSAAWSPNGQQIAFAFGNAIFVTADNGATKHQIQTFAGVPDHIRWSLDGRRILFLLRNTTGESIPWEVVLSDSDHFDVTAIVPLSRTQGKYSTISPVLDSEEDAFIGSDDSTIFLLKKSRWPWKPSFSLTGLVKELALIRDFAADTGTQQLYLLKDTPERSELDWLSRTSHEFKPFLPGISARDVDFSRDGRSIVFVRKPENSLWTADSNGSSTKQINTAGMTDIELPRWSPDGNQIAFMGKRDDAPWRIYVSLANGANLHQASRGEDNQGAPTWSPDGHQLVYGRVECQEENTCAIQQIDLKTGEQTMVQGSGGLSTARWSPDGRYIAALQADKFQVVLLDRQTGVWRKLADGVNGNDLAWAPDSKAVYASKPGGDRPEVIRISLRDGNEEPVVDLTNFSKLLGRIDTWFAVTPDNSILFLHVVSGDEVYAMRYAVR